MDLIVDGMPSTGDFATYLRVSKTGGAVGLRHFCQETGSSPEQAKEVMTKLGHDLIQHAKGLLTDQGFNNDAGATILSVVMMGMGWSGMSTVLGLSEDYVNMLKELNDMKVQSSEDKKK